MQLQSILTLHAIRVIGHVLLFFDNSAFKIVSFPPKFPLNLSPPSEESKCTLGVITSLLRSDGLDLYARVRHE